MCVIPNHGRVNYVRQSTNLATLFPTTFLNRTSTKINLSCTQDRHCTYHVTLRHVSRYIEARSFNRCRSGDAISITCSECVFVLALGIQDAMRMRHIVICDLSGSTVFIHIISKNCTNFEIKNIEEKFVF